MNKYASGYLLLSILMVAGGIIFFISLMAGFVLLVNLPDGMGFVGLLVAIFGSFQGLMLFGAAVVGSAVLDGSIAQQRIADKFAPALTNDVSKASAVERSKAKNESTSQSAPAPSVEDLRKELAKMKTGLDSL